MLQGRIPLKFHTVIRYLDEPIGYVHAFGFVASIARS